MIDNSNRFLSLKGTYNIRDLGGYQTESGNKIPWRKFLRADSLHLLNDDGMSYLQREGLRLVIDLRTEKEVKEMHLVSLDVVLSSVKLRALRSCGPLCLIKGS